MKEPMVITMAREYASGGSEIAQAVADKLGIPLYNKELITLAAKKSGLTEEAIAASENQRSGSLIYSLYMMGNTMPLADHSSEPHHQAAGRGRPLRDPWPLR